MCHTVLIQIQTCVTQYSHINRFGFEWIIIEGAGVVSCTRTSLRIQKSTDTIVAIECK